MSIARPDRLVRISFVAAVAALLLAVPETAQAQDADGVYAMNELSETPSFENPQAVARLLESSYPSELRDAGIEGSVQVSLVVTEEGRVDPSSVEVVSAEVDALADAATEVATQIEFNPGTYGGQPVPVRVILPLTYQIR